MNTTTETLDVGALPLAPKNPLPLRRLVKLVRALDIRDAARQEDNEHRSDKQNNF